MKKKDIIYISIIIILVVIILILIFSSKFEKIQNDKRTPTGNVDVFDIKIDCSNEKCDYSDETDSKDLNDNTNTIKKKSSIVVTNDKSEIINIDDNTVVPEKPSDDKIIFEDENGNFVYQKKLDIFKNAAFNYTNKIAPGVSNTYDFNVKNSSDIGLKYTINLQKTSQYEVNIKYRVKKNGTYIVGNENDYVSINNINFPESIINSNSIDKYSIDWKWFDDDSNDTLAGENMTDEYKLFIKINIEQS